MIIMQHNDCTDQEVLSLFSIHGRVVKVLSNLQNIQRNLSVLTFDHKRYWQSVCGVQCRGFSRSIISMNTKQDKSVVEDFLDNLPLNILMRRRSKCQLDETPTHCTQKVCHEFNLIFKDS